MMANRASRIADDYAEAVFARGRVRIEPPGFEPDWADQPAHYKLYPSAIRISLPETIPARIAPLRDLLGEPDTAGPPIGREPTLTDAPTQLDRLGSLLRLSYGLLDRRLDVTWNNDSLGRAQYTRAVWGRAAASGGGLYPLEIYWCAGPSAALLPGVYHYAAGHHALTRLATGDVTSQIRAAAGDHPAASGADEFLVVTARFWRNAFKYNNFSYHVVSQDVGALLGTWQLLARGLEISFVPLLWFTDERLNQILGLATRDESAFALVAVRSGPAASDRGLPAFASGQSVRHVAIERSRRVARFAMVDAVHASSLVDDEQRPAPSTAATTADVYDAGNSRSVPPPDIPLPDIPLPAVSLPAASLPDTDLVQALRTRRSSFGRFVTTPHLTMGELASVLHASAAARRFPADHKGADGRPSLTSLMVFANRVADLPSGRYYYDEAGHALVPLSGPEQSPEPVAEVLQRNYLLLNYDMGRVGAVVAIVGRPAACVDVYGNRGLRLLNAEAGAVAQVGYLAATASRIGCGAVLGFDNLGMNEALGLTGTDRRTLLFLLLGRHPDTIAAIDADLAAPRWAGNGAKTELT